MAMAKIDPYKIESIPRKIKDIMLVQPNNVTFGQYELNAIQEDVLTLVIDAIQHQITHTKELPKDLFNQPYVEIVCDEAGGKNNKAKIKKAVKAMFYKTFTFNWVHPEIHKTIESTGSIITTLHDIKGTNKLIVNFNPWAIPFLVYYGIGVGGTRFNKSIALSLKGNYNKRIYKIISRWKDKANFEYKIAKFRKELKIPDTYTNKDIRVRILESSKTKIKAANADVWFDYKMICKYPKSGVKPKADTIIFYIKTLNPEKAGGEQLQIYQYVYYWLKKCFGETSEKAINYTDKLKELGELKKVFNRAAYYNEQIQKGEKTEKHAINSLKKMLRDQYKLE